MDVTKNKPEERKPWAIINVNEPQFPQYTRVNVIRPAITVPATIIIAVPTGIKIFRWLSTVYGSQLQVIGLRKNIGKHELDIFSFPKKCKYDVL